MKFICLVAIGGTLNGRLSIFVKDVIDHRLRRTYKTHIVRFTCADRNCNWDTDMGTRSDADIYAMSKAEIYKMKLEQEYEAKVGRI